MSNQYKLHYRPPDMAITKTACGLDVSKHKLRTTTSKKETTCKRCIYSIYP